MDELYVVFSCERKDANSLNYFTSEFVWNLLYRRELSLQSERKSYPKNKAQFSGKWLVEDIEIFEHYIDDFKELFEGYPEVSAKIITYKKESGVSIGYIANQERCIQLKGFVDKCIFDLDEIPEDILYQINTIGLGNNNIKDRFTEDWKHTLNHLINSNQKLPEMMVSDAPSWLSIPDITKPQVVFSDFKGLRKEAEKPVGDTQISNMW